MEIFWFKYELTLIKLMWERGSFIEYIRARLAQLV